MKTEKVAEFSFPSEEDLKKIKGTEIEAYLKEFAILGIKKKRVLGLLADAFARIESKKERVSDIVMDPLSYSFLRKHSGYDITPETDINHLRAGLMGMLWGANVWVLTDTKGVRVFKEVSKEIKKLYPAIVSFKKKLRTINLH